MDHTSGGSRLQESPSALSVVTSKINSEGFPCRSISSLGALGGAWIWIWEFVRRQRRLEIRESGNLDVVSFWDWDLKTKFSNGLGHNGSKVSGSWAEIESVHTNFSRTIFPCVSKNTRMAVWMDLELGSCSQIYDCSTQFFLWEFERWGRGGPDIFPNLKFSKSRVPAIQKKIILN